MCYMYSFVCISYVVKLLKHQNMKNISIVDIMFILNFRLKALQLGIQL